MPTATEPTQTTTQPTTETKTRNDIGALWTMPGDTTGESFHGYITVNGERLQITVRKNQYKKADNQPVWRVYPTPERKS